MGKKIIITVGGTGGHIFPALAIAQQISNNLKNVEILFVGGNLDKNRFFNKEFFPFQSVSSATFSAKNPLSLFTGLKHINRGFWKSRKIIREFKPDLILGFGSYYTLPVLLAAKQQSIPLILHEANSVPGKVNKLFSPYANLTGIHFPETSHLLKGKTVEVGMPLRTGFEKGKLSKQVCREYFQLSSNKKTILIFGGSQGSQAINHLCLEALSHNAELASQIQVLHFTGNHDFAIKLRQNYLLKGIQAYVKDFEPRMEIALEAADVMISRAGAGTIAELMEFELPAILIPYPSATDNHQELNSKFIVDSIKGGILLTEKKLTSEILQKELIRILANDGNNLKEMSKAIKKYKVNSRKHTLISIINEFLENKR